MEVYFMKKKFLFSGLMILLMCGFSVLGQEKTRINSQSAKRKLLGKHMLSLQWISWKYFGQARVTQAKGVLYLTGEQKGKNSNDYLKLDGVINEVNPESFKFTGKITTLVSHNNGGEPCVREGEMTFAITKGRKYWRLQEMNSPCEDILDYVDIYFRR
jgi:hypothetical protein